MFSINDAVKNCKDCVKINWCGVVKKFPVHCK